MRHSFRSSHAPTLGAVSLLFALVTGASASLAWSQGPFRRGVPQQPAKLPDLQISGTIEDLRLVAVKVKSDAGQTWVLHFTPDARIRLTGKATADFLAAGQSVEVIVEVDKRRGTVSQPVSRLTVFTPTPRRPLGAVPDQGFGLPGAGTDKEAKGGDAPKTPFVAGPGRAPALGPETTFGSGLGSSRGGRRAGPAPGAKNAPAASQTLEVRGQITTIKNGKLSLHAPSPYFKSPLKLEIAEAAQIDVDLIGRDACLSAQRGDKIIARGQQLGENVGRVAEVEITLVEPLGGGQVAKKPVAKGDRPPRGTRAAPKGDSLESPLDGDGGEKKPPSKKGRKAPVEAE